MTEERWVPLPEWEGLYEISDHGRIKSLPRVSTLHHGGRRIEPGGIRRLADHKFGYKLVLLSHGKRRVMKQVHSLVLEAFVGPRPPGMVTCHNNGDPADNRLENLRWDTQSNNLFDAVRHGTHTLSNKTHCVHGHEYTPANTIRSVEGWRSCRTCKRDSEKRWAATQPKKSRKQVRPPKTHCKYGHEFTPGEHASNP